MENVEELKKLHDYYATTVQILRQRIQFYFEEFDGVKELAGFHEKMAKELREKIEALEPKEEEKKEAH